ncbi:hypothetical protein PIB30_102028 [Stylosanthes scabra]|uniref:Uncharacterized protein n=1 Tax=Stylosanthes scabra TaxID=79078 RepID=A0ABU6YXX1_9FABA|nr:hypothetical protein [Stylosanthes scabra]
MNTSERNTVKKGVMEVETVNALMAELSAMNKKFEKLEASAVSTQASCGLYGGPHENHNCSLLQDDQYAAAQVNYVGNQPRPPYNDPTPTLTISVGEITPTSVGEVIKDSKGNGTTTTLKDNPHSLHLNLLQSNRNQGEALKKVEVQVGDLAKQLQQLQHKASNAFPGNTIVNPNAECKPVNAVMVEEAPTQEEKVGGRNHTLSSSSKAEIIK